MTKTYYETPHGLAGIVRVTVTRKRTLKALRFSCLDCQIEAAHRAEESSNGGVFMEVTDGS